MSTAPENGLQACPIKEVMAKTNTPIGDLLERVIFLIILFNSIMAMIAEM
ncbi:hypothetical protein BN863_18290 [Formosa agariphila KMM 3901]|uniref:Uncharacterized protein n=1 Tax=Formosa agariphila (strain DSM 15362 / KCTC 12365 / LMG 23005 / KMM 3901 / M-2Alg 35-1) TaxID=1347342 RepID=T2KM74_FORAG|nr:hypothetical protein BN863_18290 [Formosa agariphila KMM 3901]